MRQVAETSSPFVFWEALVYTESALLGDERAAHLAGPVTKALGEFPTLLSLDMETRRAKAQTSALAGVTDSLLDGDIREVQSSVLYVTKQDRQAPAYTALFSDKISKLTRYALPKQLDVALALFERLSLSVVPEPVRAHGPKLQSAIAKGRTVLEEQRKAVLARAQARITIREWKKEVNALRLAVHSRLGEIAAQQRLGRDWPDTFFPAAPERGGRRKTAADSGLAPSVTPIAEA